MESKINNIGFDVTGIVSSALCIVHCIAVPFLTSTSSMWFQVLGNQEWIGYIFLFISFIAVCFSSVGTSKRIAAFLWFFFGCFLLSILFEDQYEWLEYSGWISSAALISTHFFNLKSCRS